VAEACEKWKAMQTRLDPQKLVFIDKTGPTGRWCGFMDEAARRRRASSLQTLKNHHNHGRAIPTLIARVLLKPAWHFNYRRTYRQSALDPLYDAGVYL